MEDNLIPAADGDHLPVTPSQRALSPPAVLQQPALTDAVHLTAIDHQWPPTLADDDRDSMWNAKSSRP
jgi:hypothetical protein